MCRDIFAVFTLLGCGVIIPINVIFNLKNTGVKELISKKDAFFLMTPTLIYGNVLIVHIAITWVLNILVCVIIYRYYQVIIKLRQRKFASWEYQNEQLFMRTIMLTEIPKKYMSDLGLVRMMNKKKIDGSKVVNVSVGRDVTKLAKLVKKHEECVLKLEKILAKYLKDPDNLPLKRPVIRRFDGNFEKVDAIDYLCNQIELFETKIKFLRTTIDANKCLPYGFVSFQNVKACHEFDRNTKSVVLAPRPADIIWDNITATSAERTNKQFWGNFFFCCLTIGWIVPNAFMGTFLSQLNRIGMLWTPFNTFMAEYPIWFSILQGVLSPIITSLVFLILPMILRKMVQFQGLVTKHEREIDVTLKLYVFFVFNNLFVFTLFSVIWSVIVNIISIAKSGNQTLTFQSVIDQLDIASQISQAILGASSFWVMYVLRVNFGAILDLLQLFSLVWRTVQRHFLSPTPRRLMEYIAPQHYNYANYYNWLLFYATISFCFALIQPLVLPIVTLYFSLDVLYKKYSLMYIFSTKAESDGQYWPFLTNCMLFACAFGNLVLFAVVWVQGGWTRAIALLPLLPCLLAFKIYINRSLYFRFKYYSSSEVDLGSSQDKGPGELDKRYQNPFRNKPLMTPMVHAKAESRLAEVCGTFGMTKFDLVKERELDQTEENLANVTAKLNLNEDPMRETPKFSHFASTETLISTREQEDKFEYDATLTPADSRVSLLADSHTPIHNYNYPGINLERSMTPVSMNAENPQVARDTINGGAQIELGSEFQLLVNNYSPPNLDHRSEISTSSSPVANESGIFNEQVNSQNQQQRQQKIERVPIFRQNSL